MLPHAARSRLMIRITALMIEILCFIENSFIFVLQYIKEFPFGLYDKSMVTLRKPYAFSPPNSILKN
jgi:hypothetical protein